MPDETPHQPEPPSAEPFERRPAPPRLKLDPPTFECQDFLLSRDWPPSLDNERPDWPLSAERLAAHRRFLPQVFIGLGSMILGSVLGLVQATTSDDSKVELILSAVAFVSFSLVGAVVILNASTGLVLARRSFERREQRRAWLEVDQAIDEIDERDLQGLLRINRAQLKEYEDLTRRQAQSSYLASHVVLGIGFLVVVGAFSAAVFAGPTASKVAAASAGVVAASIAAFIARTYLRMYEKTLTQLNHYFEQPLVSSYVLTAERLVEKMTEGRRDDAIEAVIQELSVWRSGAPKAATAPGASTSGDAGDGIGATEA